MESMHTHSNTTSSKELPDLLTALQTNKRTLVVVVPAITVFFWFLVSWITSPLRKYNGPFWAGKCLPLPFRQFH